MQVRLLRNSGMREIRAVHDYAEHEPTPEKKAEVGFSLSSWIGWYDPSSIYEAVYRAE